MRLEEINGSGNAAERLGIHPNTLRFRMKKVGVVWPEVSPAGSQPRDRASDAVTAYRLTTDDRRLTTDATRYAGVST